MVTRYTSWSPLTFFVTFHIVAIDLVSLYIAICDVWKYIEGKRDCDVSPDPDRSRTLGTLWKCAVSMAAHAGATIAISSVFPNAISALSWQTPLAWAAIGIVSYTIMILLQPVVVGTIEASRGVDNVVGKPRNFNNIGNFMAQTIIDSQNKELTLGLY